MKHIRYTKEFLEPVVLVSKSWASVCKNLGKSERGGSQTYIKNVSVKFGIDFSHFPGSAWNKGLTFSNKRADVNKYLIENSSIPSNKLKKYLWRAGLKPEMCEDCGISEWRGSNKIFSLLELDHINNNHKDNRIINLRIRCANCHATKK